MRLLAPLVLSLLVACAPKAPPPAAGPDDGPRQVVYPPESVDIQGPIPREVVMNTMQANGSALASCVPRGTVASSGGRVIVSLRLTIGPEGRVRRATLYDADVRDRAMDRCMVQRAKAIQFPDRPTHGTSVASMRVIISSP
jgi:hypothetical protein